MALRVARKQPPGATQTPERRFLAGVAGVAVGKGYVEKVRKGYLPRLRTLYRLGETTMQSSSSLSEERRDSLACSTSTCFSDVTVGVCIDCNLREKDDHYPKSPPFRMYCNDSYPYEWLNLLGLEGLVQLLAYLFDCFLLTYYYYYFGCTAWHVGS